MKVSFYKKAWEVYYNKEYLVYYLTGSCSFKCPFCFREEINAPIYSEEVCLNRYTAFTYAEPSLVFRDTDLDVLNKKNLLFFTGDPDFAEALKRPRKELTYRFNCSEIQSKDLKKTILNIIYSPSLNYEIEALRELELPKRVVQNINPRLKIPNIQELKEFYNQIKADYLRIYIR